MHSEKDLLRQFKFSGTCLLFIFLLCAWQPLIRAQDHPAHESQAGHEGMSNDMPGMDMTPTAPDPMAACSKSTATPAARSKKTTSSPYPRRVKMSP